MLSQDLWKATDSVLRHIIWDLAIKLQPSILAPGKFQEHKSLEHVLTTFFVTDGLQDGKNGGLGITPAYAVFIIPGKAS